MGAATILVGIFVVLAVGDWLAVARRSSALEHVCKPACMVALVAAAAFIPLADRSTRVPLVVALVLSTIGDVLLMLRRRDLDGDSGREDGSGADLFVAGLAAFLLAHIAYVVAFVVGGVHPVGVALGAVAVAALVLGVGRPVVVAVRRGDEPSLVAPVTAYVAVICAMAVAAFGSGRPAAAAGAVLFTGSDSTIAWERFVRPRRWMPLAIIVSYHAAQLLLVLSFR